MPQKTTDQTAAECIDGTAAIDNKWDPDFRDTGIEQARAIGGFYRSLRPESLDQHRSLPGPTFRVKCGQLLRGRLLLGIPQLRTPTYRGVIVSLIDYVQVSFAVAGVWSRVHVVSMPASSEQILSIQAGPFAPGIHRIAILLVDDEPTGVLGGIHDIIGDIYVGEDPKLDRVTAVSLPSRSEPAISTTTSGYGVALTTNAERLSTPAPMPWREGASLFVSFWGSTAQGPRPVVIAALQAGEQLGITPSVVMATPGRVSAIQVTLRAPRTDREHAWALLFTNPDVELVNVAGVVTERETRLFFSQRAVIMK